jgi:hypothetical protein
VWSDKPVLSEFEALTANAINPLPLVLSLLKDLVRASLKALGQPYSRTV